MIVVDGASTDRSVEVAEALGARVLLRENRGLGHLYNRGAGATAAEFVLLLNNDVALDARCLELLAAALDADERPLRRRPDARSTGTGRRDVHARTTLTRGRLLREYIPASTSTTTSPQRDRADGVRERRSDARPPRAPARARRLRRDVLHGLGGPRPLLARVAARLASVYVPDAGSATASAP